MKLLVTTEQIEQTIYTLRGHRVMLDGDLASMYDVEVRALIQAVKRNSSRFPLDFCFQLNQSEYESLKSQIVMSKKGRGGRRTLPYAFTEQGLAMVSSVLNSPRAIRVNVLIMRAFVRLRRILESNKELVKKLTELESKVGTHDKAIQRIFEAIYELMNPPPKPVPKIGFKNKAPTPLLMS